MPICVPSLQRKTLKRFACSLCDNQRRHLAVLPITLPSDNKKYIPMENKKIDDLDSSNDTRSESLAPTQKLALVDNGATELTLTSTDDDGNECGPDHVAGEPIDWSRLAFPPPPRIWFMDQWLTTVPTLFAAQGGTGKSLELQTMCTGLAIGKPYLAGIDKPRTCLVWSCEDDHDEILRRQAKINEYFGVTRTDELKRRLHVIPRIGLENVLMELAGGKLVKTRTFNLLREQVNDLRVEVLVLDNVAHLFGGLDERTQVTRFVNAVNGIVPDRPFAPIFVTHVSKVATSEYAGSIAWETAVRMRWYLQSVNADDDQSDGSNRLVQRIGKTNVSAKTSINLRYANGVIVPESAREVAEVIRMRADEKAKREEHVETIVIDGYEMLRDSKIRVCEKRNSRDSLIPLICKAGFQKDATKDELNAALDRLEAAKCVETAPDGKYGNGSPYITLSQIHRIPRRVPLPTAA
jgi:hypothetical protein